ncbi:tetratricopeptide repeat protein [Rufibacter immobilis]|nr:tetratricopeptide repeat protein [Rufibacter immobilis]
MPLVSASKQKIKEMSQLLKKEPKNVQAYVTRAAARMELGDLYGAIKDYSAAEELSPEDKTSILIGRGNAFLEIGAYKEALKDFDAVLEKASSPEAQYGRAAAKYFLDDLFGAMRDLDEVVTEKPEHSKALFNRAIVKMDLNQLEGAVSDLKAFLAYHPDHKDAQNALASANDQLGRRFARR